MAPASPGFYTTNALYEYIEAHGIPGYLFAKEDLWMVVYGDESSIPKLLLVISAVPVESYTGRALSPKEEAVMDLCARFAGACGLPYRVVRYPRDARPLDRVQYIEHRKRWEEIGIASLPRLFRRCGMRPTRAKSAKGINDRATSAFHLWQRDNLGKTLTVSDIDLVKAGADGRLTVYELKRSYMALEDWAPFPADAANHRLLARFAALVGASFQIVYNRRIKDPFNDDISRLKRYSYSPKAGAEYIDTMTPEEFFGDGVNG